MSDVTLFVEASTDLDVKLSGWGAVIAINGAVYSISGVVHQQPPLGTLTELEAVSLALTTAIGQGYIEKGDRVAIAMRSTAPLAVLRWVFPEAEFAGAVPIEMPKRLSKETREATSLTIIDEDAERMDLTISLMHVRSRVETVVAAEDAKKQRARAVEEHRPRRRR